MKKIAYIFLVGSSLLLKANAQNNNSPYSSIGVGNLEYSYFDRTTGLASSGVALSSNRFLLHANPASYSFLDDRLFHFESSVRYKGVNYVSDKNVTSSNQSNDLQFKKIAAAIKIKPKWGISVGLLPYSNSNYSFFSKKSTIGSSNLADTYNEGLGSINQFYGATSFKPFKNFSIGVQMAYLFGQMQNTETIFSGIGDSALITKSTVSYTNPLFSAGFIYKFNASKKVQLSIAASGNIKTKLRANHGITISYGNSTFLSNDLYKSDNYRLPTAFTTGIAALINDAYTITVDYRFQNWGGLNVSGVSYQLVDAKRIAAGFEYSKKLEFADPYTNQKIKYEKYFIQGGLFYNNGYTKVYGQQINDYGLSLGLGVNSLRSPLGIILNFEVGRRGTTNLGLVRENYSQVGLTFCYRDFWYTSKRRYN